MASAKKTKSAKKKPGGKRGSKKTRKPGIVRRNLRRIMRIAVRGLAVAVAAVVALILIYTLVNPPITQTIWSEWRRLGGVERDWVALEDIAPVMARSVVAAEDANFCLHWGFDVTAIRAAIDGGGQRGGSTISQQVVKNVFLWQGRSWIRKALETAITPFVELIWTKRRIIEVYLNVAEMDEGVFGVGAAAESYFAVAPDALSPQQAALLAAVLPSPKTRSAARPSAGVRRRSAGIMDGAATIGTDGRAECFED